MGTSPTPPLRPADPASADRGQLLLSLAHHVTGSLDLQEVLDASLAALRQLLDFGGGTIQLIEGEVLVVVAADPPLSPAAANVRIPLGEGVAGQIAVTGRADYVPDIPLDMRVHPEHRAQGVSRGVRSCLGVPLILAGGPIGVVQVDAPEVDAFDEAARQTVVAFAPTIAAAVQNARLYDQERATLGHLEEAQRLKDGFVSIVSHELRTPMTATLGLAETLATRIDHLDRPEIKDMAERILSAGYRLQDLLEGLLLASDLDRGLVEVHPQEVVVTDVARSVVATVDRHHPLVVTGDTTTRAWADPRRLHQVLSQLVDNAIKFSPPDQPVAIVVSSTGGEVQMAVEDRGRGVASDEREKVFHPFVQSEPYPTRTVGGLGIGLYLVHRLCAAMDATVTITDRSGDGARVLVTLPPVPSMRPQ